MLTISSIKSLAQENFVHMNLVRIFNEAKYFVEAKGPQNHEGLGQARP